MDEKVMDEKTGPRKLIDEEQEEIFKTMTEGYTAVSKIFEDSYVNLYKPLVESTEEMFEKAVDLSKEAAPKKYVEFYDDWMNTYKNTFGKIYPIPTLQSNKETLEKLMSCAEDSNKFYKSWINQLEENSKKTQEILKGEPDPEKYKECYDMWVSSYDKIFDEFLELPALSSTKEIFENYTGVPDIYLGAFVQIAKLWKNSYAKLYGPWIESTLKLSGKMTDISKGEATPEDYKEFYSLWMDTYKETFGKYIQSMQPSKELYENFVQSTNIYLNMYKSWIAALEKMSEKTKELSKDAVNPEAYKEFYDVWIKMYDKAFEGFFEDMPMVGPMKDMMEPVKNVAKIYSDTFNKMSKAWVKSPGKV